MSRINKIVIVVVLLFLVQTNAKSQRVLLENGDSITCQKALMAMFDSVYSIETSKFEMISYERIDGELQKNKAEVYVNYDPKKIFLRGFDSDEVLANEVLYLAGEDGNKALISPNGFPYFNLNLDPLGSTMRHNRHLTILEAGGRYLVDMLRIGVKNYINSSDTTNRFFIERETAGFLKLTVLNQDYDFVEYTVLANEQLRDVCFKLGLPEYKIIELNNEVDGYDDLFEGQVIKIPNFYAKKFELIIREADFVPLHVTIFDDLGKYSEYQYLYFDCHPYVDDQTFSSENPAYTF